MEFKDYYKIMGVGREATQDEIKRAYRKLARKYHPDVSKQDDAEAKFKEVGEAYEVLKDPEKREAYDQLGANWKAGQEFRPPPDWQQGFEFHGGGFTDRDAEQFSDFFETLFGRGGFSRGFNGQPRGEYHARGEDNHARIQIDLEDTYQGAVHKLTLQSTEIDAKGIPHQRERTLNVRIPKGVRQGQNIRLAKQGSVGFGGGERGDLFLEIEFRPHPLYSVEGKDVYLNLPIAPWEGALGAKVKVPTPSGPVDMRIPPNSHSGKRLRLKGRGIPSSKPGDLYVVLEIVLPTADSQADRKAYEDFHNALDFNPRPHMGG